ncbi:MAG: TrkA C-terminal domain-containing protein [Rubripirellula sp.]
MKSNHGFLIVGIRHSDGASHLNPGPATKLGTNDVVIVLGHKADLPEFAK